MPYYAVANGRTVGIFLDWATCNESVKGFPKAIYKKFDRKELAKEFIELNGSKEKEIKKEEQKSILSFFKDSNIEDRECKIETFVPDYYVYTDGACIHNGKENAMAGFGIYFGPSDPRNVSQRVEGKQSNQIAELTAILHTYGIVKKDLDLGIKIIIMTDSQYSILCCTTYGEKCWKKGWSADIPNKDLVKTAFLLFKNQQNLRIAHIKAHTGKDDIHSVGNEEADRLANQAIGLDSCPYQNKL
jgi:ribonuclease HI